MTVDDRIDELAGRVSALADELADLAIDQLREALGSGGTPDPVAVALERRISRARRALEKAVAVLSDRPDTGPPD